MKKWFFGFVGVALLFFICSLATAQTQTQNIKVYAAFTKDTTSVGEELLFAVSARYPAEIQILFPDSAFNFSPFEFRKKRYFITETKNNISFDSAVYHLSTFEVDSIQTLRLPVYKVNALDCTRVFSNWDTIRIRQVVDELPEKLSSDLPLKSNSAYVEVPYEFNYPVVIIVLSLLLLLAALIWLAYGSWIRKYFRVKRMQKAHDRFIASFNGQLENVRQTFSPQNTEAAIALWKGYMEQISARPYTKLTTHETYMIEKDDSLIANLKAVDSAIYGNNKKVVDSLEKLKSFADKRYETIIQKVRHE